MMDQVKEVAKVLDITLGDCEVNFRRKGEKQKKDLLVEEHLSEPQMNWNMKEEVTENSDELSCNYCGKEFKHISHLTQHKLCHKIKSVKSIDLDHTFKCRQCSDTFETKKKLAKHIIKEHGTCNECGKKYKLKGNLARHKLSHYNELTPPPPIESADTFSCSQCSNLFVSNKKLAKHVLKEHGQICTASKSDDFSKTEIRLTCKDCDKTFGKEQKLLIHIQKYHQIRNENKRVSLVSGVFAHDVINTEQLYECTNCDKSFGKKRQLSKHRFFIHSGVTIICPDCNKEFSRRDKLNAHRRIKH